MIFVTVGTQLPFDRLVSAVDAWCARHPSVPVFGQIAEPGAGGYRPKHFPAEAFLSAARTTELFERASLIVAHAGMGSIISALTLARPIVVMPRRFDLGEHRNDHQLATARRLAAKPGITIVEDAESLARSFDTYHSKGRAIPHVPSLGPFAEPRLIDAIRSFAGLARPHL